MSGTGEREIGTGAGGPEAWSAACPFCDADWDGEIEDETSEEGRRGEADPFKFPLGREWCPKITTKMSKYLNLEW